MGGVQIAPLRRYNHPDISDHVVHFTGRNGAHGPGVPDEIANLKDWERLAQILVDERILAFPPFGSNDPVVCFTACTRAGIQTLMAESPYSPCGIAFTKDFLFRKGGGPALYIRGDEWGQSKACRQNSEREPFGCGRGRRRPMASPCPGTSRARPNGFMSGSGGLLARARPPGSGSRGGTWRS